MNSVCEIKSLNLYTREILMLWEWIAALQSALAAAFAIIWTQTNCLWGGGGGGVGGGCVTCHWSGTLQQPPEWPLVETGLGGYLRELVVLRKESWDASPWGEHLILWRPIRGGGGGGGCLSQPARGRITLTWPCLQRKLQLTLKALCMREPPMSHFLGVGGFGVSKVCTCACELGVQHSGHKYLASLAGKVLQHLADGALKRIKCFQGSLQLCIGFEARSQVQNSAAV